MDSYKVELKPQAIKNLRALDKRVAQRILDKLSWLSASISEVAPEPLSADLQGYYKLRVGDYRVIYSLNHEQRRIDVAFLGHRREVYRLKR